MKNESNRNRVVDREDLSKFVESGLDYLFKKHRDLLAKTITPDEKMLELVDEFLWYEWDPIGLNSMDEIRDEYSCYVADTTLFALSGDVKLLSAWLWFLEHEYIGLSESNHSHSRNNTASMAIRLLEIVNKELSREDKGTMDYNPNDKWLGFTDPDMSAALNKAIKDNKLKLK